VATFRPDNVSVPENVRFTGVLFQPSMLGGGVRLLRASSGSVRSILIFSTTIAAVLPARSVTAPVADWLSPSVSRISVSKPPATVSTPDSASATAYITDTGVLFQPCTLLPGICCAVIAGAVLSIRNVTLSDALFPASSVAVISAV